MFRPQSSTSWSARPHPSMFPAVTRSMSGDSWGGGGESLRGGNGNAHKCKTVVLPFFQSAPLSAYIQCNFTHRLADFGFCSLPWGGRRGGARIFMLSNYQPLCSTTGLVNLFSTFSGVTKSISKAVPLVPGEHAAEEPSPHYDSTAEERREPEHVAVTNYCCTRRGEEPGSEPN